MDQVVKIAPCPAGAQSASSSCQSFVTHSFIQQSLLPVPGTSHGMKDRADSPCPLRAYVLEGKMTSNRAGCQLPCSYACERAEEERRGKSRVWEPDLSQPKYRSTKKVFLGGVAQRESGHFQFPSKVGERESMSGRAAALINRLLN